MSAPFFYNFIMKEILIKLNQRPIAVYPIYIKLTGSVTSGLLLSQIMYWYSAVNGRAFYKSDAEIMEETMLTANELRSAKLRLKSLSFMNMYLKGVPARTHYEIDADLLFSEINKSSLVKSTKLDKLNPLNSVSDINETITESTTENTTKNTTKKGCEFENPLPETKIKNSFTRQSIHDSISHEQGFKEKEKSTREKEKESQEPTETYSAFIAYCQAYENCAKVTLPKNKQGNYIMSAKDGSNCKKLISWIKQIAVVEGTMDEMVAAFTKAAWHVGDKFIRNNFSISIIYSNANSIYTKWHFNNPAAQEKRRQEEIERLVNEYQP
jgi:hypothetical protein